MTVDMDKLRKALAKATPGKWSVLKPLNDEVGFTHSIHAEGYGAVGYWRGHKSWHDDCNWLLTKDDAELIALVKPIATALLAAEAKLRAAEGDSPAGAIENGRAHMMRLEQEYDFDCEAGPLSSCADWHELRRCFEVMADYLAAYRSSGPAPQGDGCPACNDRGGILTSDLDDNGLPKEVACPECNTSAAHPQPTTEEKDNG